MSGDIFGCHNWGEERCATGIKYIEARYGALYPTTHTGQHPTTKNYLTLNILGVKLLRNPILRSL